MIKIEGLSYENEKRLNHAIERGYLDDFKDVRTWKHTFIGSFLWKYPGRVKVMDTFSNMLGMTPTWEDITDDNLRDLVDELGETGLAVSSIRTICSELKSVLNSNSSKVPTNTFARILSIRNTVSQAVYLTKDEMERFLAYSPKTECERFVHRNFSVGMLTGARLVDAIRLSVNNCDIDTNMLSYVPKKTPGIVVTLPVDERRGLRMILATRTRKPCSLDFYNDIVRSICRELHIETECSVQKAGKQVTAPKWELVSSHTARRTFATNLYLAGVSLEDIAMMMGHGKNIDTTKRYICAERVVSPKVIEYFQDEGMVI